MNIKTPKLIPWLITFGVIACVFFLRLLSLPQFYPNFDFLQRVEWDTYDWRMRALQRASTNNENKVAHNLGVVFIDDETLQWANEKYKFNWPLPRFLYGQAVKGLNALGTKAIGFDILFAEEHPTNASTMVQVAGVGMLSSDQYFAHQMKAASNKVVLAVMGETSRFEDEEKTKKAELKWRPLLPTELFATNAGRLAHIVSANDADGTLRRAIPFRDDQYGKTGRHWNMSIVLASMALGLDLDKAVVEKNRIILRGTNGLERIIPIFDDGTFLINWSLPFGDKRLTTVGLDILLDQNRRFEDDVEKLKQLSGKLVVIGSIGTGNNIADRGQTPIENETFLVSKHWNVANMIIMDQFIRTCSLTVELLLIALMGLLGAFITWSLRPWVSTLWVTACAIVYIAAAYWIFTTQLVWLPIITPVVAAMLSCHFATMTYRVVFEQREKRRIKGIFSKLVAPDVVNELLDSEHLELGGAQRRITVFFADVRGFTELTDSAQARAEDYVKQHKLEGEEAHRYLDEQARDMLATVNLYLSAVSNKIKEYGGTLDKYIGDCVMAFWGAPIADEKHALNCVKAAVAAQKAIYEVNVKRMEQNKKNEQENIKRAAESKPTLPPLSLLTLGSGINTGVVTVGLMGSDEHIINYTVFGREVNLASRLEGVSGRGRIIIGQSTYEDIKRDDPELAATCVAQAPVMVKGIKKPVQIYEVPWRQGGAKPSVTAASPMPSAAPLTPSHTSASITSTPKPPAETAALLNSSSNPLTASKTKTAAPQAMPPLSGESDHQTSNTAL